MATANKSRGEVALPTKFGKGIIISFTVDAMERLEAEYGEDWVDIILEGTGKSRVPMFKTILSNTLVKGDEGFDYAPLAGLLSETRAAILDALFLTIHGRTVEEQMAKEDADKLAGIEKHLEKMGQDPQMASAILFLQSFGALGTEPASDPTKSDALPQEK